MTRLTSETHPCDRVMHERAIEALAHEACVPIAQVAQIYDQELAVLTAGARITGFLTILTMRKVRKLLRQGRPPGYAPPSVEAPAHDAVER